MKSLYLECKSGISGDMAVAALLDLGADKAVLQKVLDSMPLEGFKTEISRVQKSGIDVCDFNVILEHDNHDHDMTYLFGNSSSCHEHAHEHEHSHEHEGHHHHEHGHHHEHDAQFCEEHCHDYGDEAHTHEHHHEEHHHEHGEHHHHEHRHEGESEDEYGIGSFVYTRRQPFDRKKLDEYASRWPKNIIRCKGVIWFADEPDMAWVFETAGSQISAGYSGSWLAVENKATQKKVLDSDPRMKKNWDEKYGDRMIKLIVIGTHLDHEKISAELDQLLVPEDELDKVFLLQKM